MASTASTNVNLYGNTPTGNNHYQPLPPPKVNLGTEIQNESLTDSYSAPPILPRAPIQPKLDSDSIHIIYEYNSNKYIKYPHDENLYFMHKDTNYSDSYNVIKPSNLIKLYIDDTNLTSNNTVNTLYTGRCTDEDNKVIILTDIVNSYKPTTRLDTYNKIYQNTSIYINNNFYYVKINNIRYLECFLTKNLYIIKDTNESNVKKYIYFPNSIVVVLINYHSVYSLNITETEEYNFTTKKLNNFNSSENTKLKFDKNPMKDNPPPASSVGFSNPMYGPHTGVHSNKALPHLPSKEQNLKVEFKPKPSNAPHTTSKEIVELSLINITDDSEIEFLNASIGNNNNPDHNNNHGEMPYVINIPYDNIIPIDNTHNTILILTQDSFEIDKIRLPKKFTDSLLLLYINNSYYILYINKDTKETEYISINPPYINDALLKLKKIYNLPHYEINEASDQEFIKQNSDLSKALDEENKENKDSLKKKLNNIKQICILTLIKKVPIPQLPLPSDNQHPSALEAKKKIIMPSNTINHIRRLTFTYKKLIKKKQGIIFYNDLTEQNKITPSNYAQFSTQWEKVYNSIKLPSTANNIIFYICDDKFFRFIMNIDITETTNNHTKLVNKTNRYNISRDIYQDNIIDLIYDVVYNDNKPSEAVIMSVMKPAQKTKKQKKTGQKTGQKRDKDDLDYLLGSIDDLLHKSQTINLYKIISIGPDNSSHRGGSKTCKNTQNKTGGSKQTRKVKRNYKTSSDKRSKTNVKHNNLSKKKQQGKRKRKTKKL
jgi:hypothetical protein